MKKISSFIIQLIVIFSCHAQQVKGQSVKKNENQSNPTFVKEFLNSFPFCTCPYYTQSIALRPETLIDNYKLIPKNIISKYISRDSVDIGYDYVIADFDHPENSKPGYAEYRYHYLCQFNVKNYHLIMYMKDEGQDSTLFYLANYDLNGKYLDKLKIHCFIADEEIRKSVINADFTIKLCKYKPILQGTKTKITLCHYKLNFSTGKFDFINEEESKFVETPFPNYLFSKRSIPDDPIQMQ